MTNDNLIFYSSPLQSIVTIHLGLVLTKVSTSSEITTEMSLWIFARAKTFQTIIVQSKERIQFIIFILSHIIIKNIKVDGGGHVPRASSRIRRCIYLYPIYLYPLIGRQMNRRCWVCNRVYIGRNATALYKFALYGAYEPSVQSATSF